MSRKKDFFITPYGRSAWVSRWLDGSLDWQELDAMMARSYELATAKPKRASQPRRR